MNFNKKVLALLLVLMCSIAVVGCSKSVSIPTATLSITVQDSAQAGISGLVMHYTDPNGAALTTTSNAQGKMTIAINPTGLYTITSFSYPVGLLTVSTPYTGSPLSLPAISASLLVRFSPAPLYTPTVTLSL